MNNELVVERCVECYEKEEPYRLIKRIELLDPGLEVLREIFDQHEDDLMYEMFKMNKEQAKELMPYVGEQIDVEQYDCFLACFTSNN